ncbi:Ldh family oxidoreductase [Roseicitreum antarcticum]|uniref:Malate/lactate/ureidoglycolate dehydrogenase, LDH2 family n=1 Tax=Roseicitreum antarcticum TaxID=564137 RepID=A0A1H3AIT8_9RHOB|nr:Ldh family oxidoreductase [Roseicitreum antarcticum]SDX29632.1 Malate/lactate/ureidoglycolate dehydrogenase, LDH2 family [Roseicitreum antarcticum]
MTQVFSASRLTEFVAAILQAEGLPPADAATVAGLMVEADLLGGDGHGVFRLPRYLERLRAGGFNARPNIRIERERGAMAVVDGDNGFGHLVMKFCADEAVRRARSHGVGWVGAHHSNHAGAAGVYAMIPLAEDMIGLYVAVGSANHMAPWGGLESLLSTNPIAVAVPATGRKSVLLDMATTVAAYGKVKLAAQRGEMMPPDWMIDVDGNPLTDPARAAEGLLMPIGGPKGYGLSLIFGLLAGTLNGAALGRDVIDYNHDDDSVTNTGQFIVAIDIASFTDLDRFKAEVARIGDEMTGSARRPGFDAIRLPGERALTIRDQRLADGVPLPASMVQKLDDIAKGCGVAPLQKGQA